MQSTGRASGILTRGRNSCHAARIYMDSRKSVAGNSLQESLYSFTFIINVSHNFYKNLFGFSQNLLEENLRKNEFSDSRQISSPDESWSEGQVRQL